MPTHISAWCQDACISVDHQQHLMCVGIANRMVQIRFSFVTAFSSSALDALSKEMLSTTLWIPIITLFAWFVILPKIRRWCLIIDLDCCNGILKPNLTWIIWLVMSMPFANTSALHPERSASRELIRAFKINSLLSQNVVGRQLPFSIHQQSFGEGFLWFVDTYSHTVKHSSGHQHCFGEGFLSSVKRTVNKSSTKLSSVLILTLVNG